MQSIEVVLNRIKDQITIDVKIAMSDVISNTDYFWPGNLWTFGQEFSFGNFIYLLDAFAYSLYQHTVSSQFLHST